MATQLLAGKLANAVLRLQNGPGTMPERLTFVLTNCLAKFTFYESELPQEVRSRWRALYAPSLPPNGNEAWTQAFRERIASAVNATTELEVAERVRDILALRFDDITDLFT